MSTAPDYTPQTSFADDETNNVAGRSLVKTTSLDSELADISASINALNANQQALQRDDGKLQDSTVEPYALSEQTNALIAVGGCNPRGTWAQNTDYAFKDIVQRSNIAQICLQAHNSGTTFTQALWLPISGDGTSAANAAAAAASATSSSNSASSASSSATAASNSSASASTSADVATTAATNAGNSASSASISANNASISATAADTSAQASAASAASINTPITQSGDPTHASNSDTNPVTPLWTLGRFGSLRHGITSFSSAYTPSAGETLSRAHSLSVIPQSARLVLKCVVADAGYSIGEKVMPNGQWNGSATAPLPTIYMDATNIGTKCATGYSVFITNKTTGAAVTPTSSAWQYAFQYTY